MSTGLSGEQLDALRAEIYAAMCAIGDEYQAMSDCDEIKAGVLFGRSEGLSHALILLDNARRAARLSKTGSKR